MLVAFYKDVRIISFIKAYFIKNKILIYIILTICDWGD